MSTTTTTNPQTPDEKLIKPISLAHVVLRTSNKDRLRDFYINFLGCHVQFESGPLSFLTYDEEHHRIALVQIPGTASKMQKTCGLEHIAFTYASLKDLATAYRQRLAHGIKPFWCVNHGPTISMYFKDPDGNMLEWQVDNFASADEANEFMMGPEFKENPIGVDMDPEELMRRLDSGESEESIRVRPNIGPRGEVPDFTES